VGKGRLAGAELRQIITYTKMWEASRETTCAAHLIKTDDIVKALDARNKDSHMRHGVCQRHLFVFQLNLEVIVDGITKAINNVLGPLTNMLK